VVVEGVGGATLGHAIGHVAPNGTVVSFASTTADETSFPTRELFGRAPGARLYGLLIFRELAREASGAGDLARLAAVVEDGRLDCSIEREASWREAGEHVQALIDRTVTGKVVLHVD